MYAFSSESRELTRFVLRGAAADPPVHLSRACIDEWDLLHMSLCSRILEDSPNACFDPRICCFFRRGGWAVELIQVSWRHVSCPPRLCQPDDVHHKYTMRHGR